MCPFSSLRGEGVCGLRPTYQICVVPYMYAGHLLLRCDHVNTTFDTNLMTQSVKTSPYCQENCLGFLIVTF